MPHPVALTVITEILPGKTGELKEALGSIQENRRGSAL